MIYCLIWSGPLNNDELKYKVETKDLYRRFGADVLGSVAYKLKREIKSVSIGAKYYYGLVNVYKEKLYDSKYSSLYIFVRIPIGTRKE